MLEEDGMHLGIEADISAHLLDISGKMFNCVGYGHRSRLECHTK